jgi:hypothetical protein
VWLKPLSLRHLRSPYWAGWLPGLLAGQSVILAAIWSLEYLPHLSRQPSLVGFELPQQPYHVRAQVDVGHVDKVFCKNASPAVSGLEGPRVGGFLSGMGRFSGPLCGHSP